MKERIVLLGPPASGKGTQAEFLQAKFNLPIASPGAMLREERRRGTDLGREAEELTKDGHLLPDDLILQVVASWFESLPQPRFILDGFPRSIVQADGLAAMLQRQGAPLQVALALDVPEEQLFARVASRLMCLACGRIVGVGLQVKTATDVCPHCGGALGRRSDDTPAVLATRLKEYREKTEPLLAYYETRGLLARVDSEREAGEVFQSILQLLQQA